MAASLGVGGIAAIWTGIDGAVSGLLGGGINALAGAAYVALARIGDTSTPGAAVGTMIRAEAGKIALIVLLLWLVLTMYRDIVHIAFFSAFVVTVLVSLTAILGRD